MEDAKQQLQLIEEMISTAKGRLSDSSIFYLLWGWLVFIAAITNYSLLNFTKYEFPWIAWPVLMTLGGIVSGVIGYRKGKEKTTTSYIDKFLSALWLGFMVSLVVVILGLTAVGAKATYPAFMILYGLATFVSGAALRFKPLQIGAVASWVCAAISFYVAFSDQLILIAVAVLFSYIIPGHLLSAKYKKSV